MPGTIDLREILTDRIRVLYRHTKEHAAEIMEKHDRHFPPRILAWDAEGNETLEEFPDGPVDERPEKGREALRRLASQSERVGLIYLEGPPDSAVAEGTNGDDGEEHLCLELFDRHCPFQVDLVVPFAFENGKCAFGPPAVAGVRPSTSLVEE